MPKEKHQKSEPSDGDKPFWSWDIKLLILVNIVFLGVIGAGLVMVYKALSPSIQAYTQNIDLK